MHIIMKSAFVEIVTLMKSPYSHGIIPKSALYRSPRHTMHNIFGSSTALSRLMRGSRKAVSLFTILSLVVMSAPAGFAFADSTSILDDSNPSGVGSFGSGASTNDVPSWDEEGNDDDATTIAQASASDNDSASPNGGRFAKIGAAEWICREVNAAGYKDLMLSYHWRGDSDADDATDDGIVEYKAGSGSCTASDWVQLQNHDMRSDGTWTNQAAFALPAALADTTFRIRFRNATDESYEYFRVDGVRVTGNAIPTYTITTASGVGGSVTPGGPVVLDEGANQSFSITPTSGYVVSNVSVDGSSQGRLNTYTFSSVSANHSISATFDGGWRAPTDSSDGDNDVSGETNVYTSNNSYAVFDSQNDEASFDDFGFAIPSNATITGIEVAVEGNRTSPRTIDVRLSSNNGSTWTSGSGTGVKNFGSTFTASDSTVVLGSPSDTWGRSWSASDFSDTNFRLELDAVTTAPGDALSIDQLQVKVHYVLKGSVTIVKQTIPDGDSANFNFTIGDGEEVTEDLNVRRNDGYEFRVTGRARTFFSSRNP